MQPFFVSIIRLNKFHSTHLRQNLNDEVFLTKLKCPIINQKPQLTNIVKMLVIIKSLLR